MLNTEVRIGYNNLIFLLLFLDNIYIYFITSPENEFPLAFERSSYVFNVSELSPGK